MREEKRKRLIESLLHVAAIMVVGVLAGGCAGGTPATGQPMAPANVQPATSPLSPTAKPSATASSTATSIPGFEGWSVINPQDVEIKADNGALILTLTHKALWFMEQRGVLLYKPTGGNFEITADVRTSKSSDPSQPPGRNGSVQLGGVMVRNGEGVRENYVFVVVGDDGNGLSVETKNTVDSLSKFDGPDWGSSRAELRLCRFGSTISLYKRHGGTHVAWQLAGSYERADLPGTLQVGLNIYTDGAPDLQVTYENIKVETLMTNEQCRQ